MIPEVLVENNVAVYDVPSIVKPSRDGLGKRYVTGNDKLNKTARLN